ncbi:MAG: hypothetical protein J0I06_00810 [Planctomycetes bacterium]|nr:hypothetical protein [Planctomycetota bacterium]
MWVQRVPGGGIYGLAFAPDGRTLYVADRSCTFTAWDPVTRTGRPLFRLTGRDRTGIHGIAPAAGGRYLVVKGYPNVLAWDLVAGAEADRLHPPSPHDAYPLPGADGRVLYRSEDRRSLFVWEPESGTAGVAFAGPFPDAIRVYDLSPDARTVAVVGDFSSVVKLFDVAARTVAVRFAAGYSFVWDLRFAPDGRTLAVSSGRQVDLWDVSPPARRRTGPVEIDNRHGPATFAFHPTAPVFAALNREKVLTLFSAGTGAPLRSLDFALGRSVTCVCFAPDGLTCAVGGSNKQFAVFDVDL